MGGWKMARDEENAFGSEDSKPAPQEPRLRLVLAGRSGAGKSATGNTVLGRQHFFSRLGATPATRTCALGSCRWAGWRLEVVDTPDLWGSAGPEPEPAWWERARCYVLSAPGPHALLLVTQLGRFTAQDVRAVQGLRAMFGPEVLARAVLVFTRKDDLEGGSLLDFVRDTDHRALRELVAACGGRVCGLDNGAAGPAREAQRQELLALVQDLAWAHGGAPYSNDVYCLVQALGRQGPEDRLRRVAESVAARMRGRRGRWPAAWLWPWSGATRAWRMLGLAALLGGAVVLYLLLSRHWPEASGT